MSKQTPPASTASAVGPCPTIIQIVGRPETGSLPSTISGRLSQREGESWLVVMGLLLLLCCFTSTVNI